ncbi:hypothetical protein [Cellulomonas sp.]|uniref:hypothetical protein n=1 Tax=Cellulomonas sp. TaxID=40001 RepID=UPI003BAC725D
MSVMILGSEHANYLATAAVALDVIPAHQGSSLARALLQENVDAYLTRYWDGPGTFSDWEELDEDEKDDELLQIRQMLDRHEFVRTPEDRLTAPGINTAIERWQYQVSEWRYQRAEFDRDPLPGWQAMERLLHTIAVRGV